ncbi:2-oxo-4-hydroxy-4-carboxy-5-ureidoimidazoline decarboxylase [Streptomyces sp. NPDC050732]|uniref:2-oxo-4-hydroxy-4-carboxy-5-ureidoimidazoline decarboxylase n=1 Tax=Streptomyces sp. NPDC050732 TaxID=3154632 RepID=UPI00342D0FA3
MPPHQPTQLDVLNSATPTAAEATLLSCCGSRRWARRVAAHRPYPDVDALLAASDEAAYDLSHADLVEALACEPLGPAVPRRSVPRRSVPPATSAAAHTALRAAHAAYESRFGHTFVICLDDIAPDEALDHLLAGIRSRLGNDPEDERALAAEEMRRLARGRLARLARLALGAVPEIPAGHAVGQAVGHAARESRPQTRPDSPYVPV